MKILWLLGMVAGLAAGIACRFLLIAMLGGEAVGKDASNYWSTFSRIQEGVAARAPLAVCGSSITGRLPGAGQGYEKVANFGSDGGSSADGVSMIVDGIVPMPKQLVFETNTLEGYLISGVKRSVDPGSAWFRAGVSCEIVSANMRPSKILYGRALSRPNVLSNQAEPYPVEAGPSRLRSGKSRPIELTDLEQNRLAELIEQLNTLRSAGCEILLVQFPSQPINAEFLPKQEFLVAELSNKVGVPFWDLQALVPEDQVKMTDSVHMSPSSAARTLRTIENYFVGTL